MKKIFLALIAFFLLLIIANIVYFLVTKEYGLSEPLVGLVVKERVVKGNTDVFLEPGNKKVGYFVPGQEFTLTGEKKDGFIRVIDKDGYQLWIREGSPYGVKK